MLGYVGPSGIPKLIQGARDEKEALKKFKENSESLLRPVVSFFYLPFFMWIEGQNDGSTLLIKTFL